MTDTRNFFTNCMPEDKPSLIAAIDFIEVIRIPILMIISWAIPERHWDVIAGSFARAHSVAEYVVTVCRSVTRLRPRAVTDNVDDEQSVATRNWKETRTRAAYLARMQAYRDYRPGGWKPSIKVVGAERIDDAFNEKNGVLLWITPLAYSDIGTKMGLHGIGYSVSHLSRPQHGFSTSAFGKRWLNPIWTRIEDRYLAERIRIRDDDGPGPALQSLRDRLKANQAVSITVGDQGRRTVQVNVIGSSMNIATGAVHLARTAKTVLLPVFTIRKANGSLVVNVERPLDLFAEDEHIDPYGAIAKLYVKSLEPYVLSHPEQWNLPSKKCKSTTPEKQENS